MCCDYDHFSRLKEMKTIAFTNRIKLNIYSIFIHMRHAAISPLEMRERIWTMNIFLSLGLHGGQVGSGMSTESYDKMSLRIRRILHVLLEFVSNGNHLNYISENWINTKYFTRTWPKLYNAPNHADKIIQIFIRYSEKIFKNSLDHEEMMENMIRCNQIISFCHNQQNCLEKIWEFEDEIKPRTNGLLKRQTNIIFNKMRSGKV